jgi:hypothetical protein
MWPPPVNLYDQACFEFSLFRAVARV